MGPRAATVLARLSWGAMRRRFSAAIALVGLVATCLSSSLVAVTPTSAAPTFTARRLDFDHPGDE